MYTSLFVDDPFPGHIIHLSYYIAIHMGNFFNITVAK